MPVILTTPFSPSPEFITEDFSGGAGDGPIQTIFPANWAEVTDWGNPGSGDIYVEGPPDNYVRKNGGFSLWHAAYHTTIAPSADVRVEANIQLDGLIGVIGLFARMTTPTVAPADGYFFGRSLVGHNRYQLTVVGPGVGDQTDITPFVNTGDSTSGSFKMTFECIGNQFFGYFDDILKISGTHGAGGQIGYCGLIGYNSWNVNTMLWNDFKVTDLS